MERMEEERERERDNVRGETEGEDAGVAMSGEEGSYRPLFIVNVSVLERGMTQRTDRQ